MKTLSRRYTMFIILLLITYALSAGISALRKRPAGDVSIFQLPPVLGEWRSRELPVQREVFGILETDEVLMREYRRGTQKVMLAIVHYTDNRVAFHLPESCFDSYGSHMTQHGSLALDGANARTFVVEGAGRTTTVAYYFATGTFRTGDYQQLRLRMIKDFLTGKYHGSMMIRLSVERPHADSDRADLESLTAFNSALNVALFKGDR